MIDFNNLTVYRMIMHTINAKVEPQDHATVDYGDSLLDNDEEVIGIIKTRLTDAAGKQSKAFELEIEDTDQGSFFSLCKDMMKGQVESDFINTSKTIADLLAECQTKVSIPGGYLIILDCKDEISDCSIYIIIKAEPHEALTKIAGQSQISLLRKVFLSPSQKLYKIGILFEKENPTSVDVNGQYGCFLFDDQFRKNSTPAEYFYKSFLGFSVGNNSKIQSQRFFEKAEKFIKENFEDYEEKSDLINSLKLEFTTNQESLIHPTNFAHKYMPTIGLRDKFITDVVNDLPPAIVKDSTLIKSNLTKRKVDFSNKIMILGPEENFEERVQILTEEDLGNLDLNQQGFTLVKIMGKPFSNE